MLDAVLEFVDAWLVVLALAALLIRLTFFRPSRAFDQVLTMLADEQGDWYVEATLCRELAKVLQHNTKTLYETDESDDDESADGESEDGESADSESEGGESADSESEDGESADGGSTDGGPEDGGSEDGGPEDGGSEDGGPEDGGSEDGEFERRRAPSFVKPRVCRTFFSEPLSLEGPAPAPDK